MYCPGMWNDPPVNSVHTPPKHCPEGSNIPLAISDADIIGKCVCLPGYSFGKFDLIYDEDQNHAADALVSSPSFYCSKCKSGTFKEAQDNTPCDGRCMDGGGSNRGAVHRSQCYCRVGLYAVDTSTELGSNDSEDIISCIPCIPGAVCPGGFKDSVQRRLLEDSHISDIDLTGHVVPFPQAGFYAVYKPKNVDEWVISMVPHGVNFTVVDALSHDGKVLTRVVEPTSSISLVHVTSSDEFGMGHSASNGSRYSGDTKI